MTAALPKTATPLAPALALATAAVLLSACAGLTPPPSEAAVAYLSAEDSQVRIDELRVRGQTQRLVVQPKAAAGAASAPAYEVLPAPGGQDPSQAKDSTGRRVWPVLSF